MGMPFIEKDNDVFLDTIDTCANKCIFDTNITFLCGNNHFYQSTGYTKEEYHSLFPDFHEYYKNHSEEFYKIREVINRAIFLNEKGFTLDCRMPVKNGTFLWVRVNGTITNETVNGDPVFYMIYSDISDFVHLKDEQTQYFE